MLAPMPIQMPDDPPPKPPMMPPNSAAGNLAECFRNSNRRLAAARQHRRLEIALRLVRLPRERPTDRRELAGVSRGLAKDVGEQIVVALRHLAVDDDFVLDVHVCRRRARSRGDSGRR